MWQHGAGAGDKITPRGVQLFSKFFIKHSEYLETVLALTTYRFSKRTSMDTGHYMIVIFIDYKKIQQIFHLDIQT